MILPRLYAIPSAYIDMPDSPEVEVSMDGLLADQHFQLFSLLDITHYFIS